MTVTLPNCNPDARACSRKKGPDCRFLTSALSFWCTNEGSNRLRGTTIPGVIKCPFYEPLQATRLGRVIGRISTWLAGWIYPSAITSGNYRRGNSCYSPTAKPKS